ncbi:MAG TPA: acyltransferase family protein [Steroidobacteraceae bacterium]
MREPDGAPSHGSRISKRIAPIDATRGCAMLMVCLSHIKEHFESTAPWVHWFLLTITRVATPTFLLLSGFVIGYLLRTDTRRMAGISLVDRALFLLLVAHVLIGWDELQKLSLMHWLFGRALITDAIAIALFVAVLLRQASTFMLITLGATLCLGSWMLALFINLQASWAVTLANTLFSSRGAAAGALDAPLIPYVGMFLVGMGLSRWSHQALLARADRGLARRFFTIGGIAMLITAAGAATWHFGKAHFMAMFADPESALLIRQTLDPRSKWPPSPAYLIFYGGSGLLMLAFLFNGWPARLVEPLKRATSVIGRASLMCFVVQDWVLIQIPLMTGLYQVTSIPFWVAWFSVTLLLLYALARAWDNANGNRFLTVGLKAWRRRRILAGVTPPNVAQQ